ncbi:MAG: GTPase HflX [Peptoniphilaceae bacterium]|nr:GTPase HflX [Peptoniphilaceae bacterium]MDD7383573.1 GTPase HflX [Peptoniphilaceae bacterium]MDY3738746.1 GTPase HflX [Peptoniphilaceae bacterium]
MQRVIQVNVFEKKEDKSKIEELERLINTAKGEVEIFVSQVIEKPNPAFFIGKGKAIEISEVAKNNNIETAIFDVELSASQVRNLEELMKIKVVDRTTLILDIFAMRANTKESKLKIHLAQLKYSLPRLNKWFSYLSRQAGGIGTRGPGETMLETDRRAVIRDIKSIEKKLEKIEKTKNVNRLSRKNSFKISLVGYTNAGKSTILNKMLENYGLEKYVYSDDKLFATLDTSTRKLKFDKMEVILTDTVGFIENLSKELYDSFLTTLEEIKFSDMLLIIIDSSTNIDYQINAIEDSIKNINVFEKDILYVFNKMDTQENDINVKSYKKDSERIFISAKNNEDIKKLKEKILEIIKRNYVMAKFFIPFSNGDVLDYFLSNYKVENVKYLPDGTYFNVQVSKNDYNKYKDFVNV